MASYTAVRVSNSRMTVLQDVSPVGWDAYLESCRSWVLHNSCCVDWSSARFEFYGMGILQDSCPAEPVSRKPQSYETHVTEDLHSVGLQFCKTRVSPNFDPLWHASNPLLAIVAIVCAYWAQFHWTCFAVWSWWIKKGFFIRIHTLWLQWHSWWNVVPEILAIAK